MTKKFTYLLSAVALIAASCQSPKSGDVKEPGTGNLTTIPDSDKVSYDVAKKYVGNYSKHAGYVDQDSVPGINNVKRPKKADTRCIWFSRERLTQMLAQLDKEGGDGIRFYLMTYNDKYNPVADHKYKPIPPRDHWGYNSLLMVSTKDSIAHGQTFHRDYYTDLGHMMGNSRTKNHGFIVGIEPENRGEICPPPSNCQDIGATLIVDN